VSIVSGSGGSADLAAVTTHVRTGAIVTAVE
jgi:hypothetical protein